MRFPRWNFIYQAARSGVTSGRTSRLWPPLFGTFQKSRRLFPSYASLHQLNTHTKKNLGNIPQSPRVLNSQRPVPTLRTLIKLSAGEKAAERRRRLARCQMFHFNQVGTFFPARLVRPCVGVDKVLKDATAAHQGRSAVAASAPVTEDARQSHEQKTSSESKHRLNL